MANPIYGQNKADLSMGAYVTTAVGGIGSGVVVYVTAPISGFIEGATMMCSTAVTTNTAQLALTNNAGDSVATYAADKAGIPVTAINKGCVVAEKLSDNSGAACNPGDTFVFTFGSEAGAGAGEMTVHFVPTKSV